MQDEYSYIPRDMKPVLVNNDTVYYLDKEHNRIDTFLVNLYNYYDVSDGRYYSQNIDVYYNLLNKQSTFNFFDSGYGVNGASNSIEAHYFRTIRKGENNTDIIKNNLSIQGVIYPTVYVLHASDFPDSIPNTVYFTFQHGIVRYDYSDGRQYELIKK